MSHAADRSLLRSLREMDPDGGETEPTEADYAAFERYVVEAFGEDVWRAYNRPGWDDPEF